jgi:hypothetical protein
VALLVSAQGTQFITGPCASDAECASGCCQFETGTCGGAVVALERGGCGFGDAQPNSNAADALTGKANQIQSPAGNTNAQEEANATTPAAPAEPSGSGQAPAAAAPGTQFITGPCSSDADCASSCCGFNSLKCAGPVVAQERDGGCGGGSGVPNDDAAVALQGRTLGRRGPAMM